MRRTLICLAVLLGSHAGITEADDKTVSAPARLDAFVIEGKKVKPIDSDAPLAEGWPKATQPGLIEVKSYPGYRSAVARGKGAAYGADNVLFWPLFNHITKSEIAMTTPVVSTYSAETIKEPKARGDVSMEFVYRSPTMGQTGQGVGAVKVMDHPASAFVCLGVQAEIDPERMRKGVEVLRTWLNDHKTDWVEDGQPRRLGYHGPMTPRDERLWEIQIPVKAVPKPAIQPKAGEPKA